MSFFKQEFLSYLLSAIFLLFGIKPEDTISKILSKFFGGDFIMLSSWLFQAPMVLIAIALICHSQRKHFEKNLKQQDEQRAKNENIPTVPLETKEENKDVLNGWESYRKALVNQLNDYDVEKIAGGHFDENKSLFTYHSYSPRKIEIGFSSVVDFNKHHFKEEISLPRKTKTITIALEVFDRSSSEEISDLEIFVKVDGSFVKLNKIKEIALVYERDNPIEFYFDGLTQKLFALNVFLLVKSFTL